MMVVIVSFFSCALGFLLGLAWNKGPKAKPADDHAASLLPSAGELWQFAPRGRGPWPVGHYKPVTVLDVAEGWVRYSMGEIFTDERLTVEDFTRMYRKV